MRGKFYQIIEHAGKPTETLWLIATDQQFTLFMAQGKQGDFCYGITHAPMKEIDGQREQIEPAQFLVEIDKMNNAGWVKKLESTMETLFEEA